MRLGFLLTFLGAFLMTSSATMAQYYDQGKAKKYALDTTTFQIFVILFKVQSEKSNCGFKISKTSKQERKF